MPADLPRALAHLQAGGHRVWRAGMLCQWEPRRGAGGQQCFPTHARVAELPQGPLSLMYCLVDPGHVYADAVPDLEDAATRGCLLELLREVTGDPHVHIVPTVAPPVPEAAWVVVSHTYIPPGVPASGASEGEAIAAALVAVAEGVGCGG